MENTVDLNALTAPEGTPKENFEQFGETKEPTSQASISDFHGLPNLDPPVEETTPSEKKEKPATEDAPAAEAPAAAAAPAAKPADTLWFHKPFLDLQKKLGLKDEEFKIPEGLTEENYIDKYNEILYENTEFEDPDLHPELRNINELIKKGVDFNEAVSAYQRMNNLEALPDKELVKLSLKQQFGKSEENKDGWDDDKIDERVSKMETSGYLEIEAQRLRDQIKTEKQNINSRYEQSIKAQDLKRSEALEKQRTEQINSSLEFLSGMKEVYGIPVSKAELSEFKEDFIYLVTPNKETGISPIMEFMQSNENLVKLAYFIKKGDEKIRTALTKAKEDTKRSIEEKLDDKPPLPKKTSTHVDEGAINLDALTRGARD